uniref:SMC hinge domain-containing protein n=1 Tax=Timema bartmani TaxID=61472 RepID=A0A7R9F625_9NEOP|nr:unnamed protein product [Timema bartmani]
MLRYLSRNASNHRNACWFKCFTAIIGPNGSGKSNIIDSMLFVFGYRASKIRSKKISVLIHNSSKYSNINSCTVKVHFQQIIDKDDEDSYDVVPNSQFVISRTAFKDSSSYYTIDNKRVQFKEVAKLLRFHGIDLDHNRFLILQEPLQKIIQLGNDLNQERSEKLNRVKMVEKEKDSLEEPKNEALKYLKLKNEYTQMLNIDYQLGIHETEQKILEKETGRKSLDDSMAEMKAELRRIAQEKNEIQKADNELKKYVVSLLELEKVPEKNESEIQELSRNEEKLSNQREVEEAALKRTMDGLKAETQELQDQKTSLQTRLIELNVTKNATKSQARGHAASFGATRAKMPVHQYQFGVCCSLATRLGPPSSQTDHWLDIISSELDIYIQNEQKEKTKLEQIQNNLDNTIHRLAECREGQLDLQSRIPAVKEEIQAARARLVLVKKEEAEVGAELQNVCRQVEEARSSMRATKSQGAVVDFLMAEKTSGRLPGIFGRLGDLGAIDQRYDVAVSTACGALDNIVVDTVTTAEHCIECLRRNDVGRATFIALEKQERWRQNCNKKIKTPENVPRLFDLIQVQNEQLKTAFYFALRDTLVAQDLEQATRIAYGAERHRVVTLGGELIELSGTMSGGGNRVLKGKMGQRVVSQSPAASVKEVERMEHRVEMLQQRHQELQQEHTALEEQLSALAPQLQHMNTDLYKFNIDLQTHEAHEPVLKEQLKKQKEKLLAAAPDPVQLNNKTANVNKARKSYECAAAAAEEVDKEVQKLHKQIMEITEGRMKAAQKKLDVVNKKIDKTRQDATRLKVAIKTADRNAKKSRDKIANMEEEIHTAETNIISLRKQTEQIEQETKKILDLFNIACDKIKEHNAKQMDLKSKLDKLDQEEGKIKLEKLEFDQKLEALDTHIKGIKSKQTNLKKSVS